MKSPDSIAEKHAMEAVERLYDFTTAWDEKFPYYATGTANGDKPEPRPTFKTLEEYTKDLNDRGAQWQALEDQIIAKKFIRPFGKFGIMGILGVLLLVASAILNPYFGLAFLLMAISGSVLDTKDQTYTRYFTTLLLLITIITGDYMSGILGAISVALILPSLVTWKMLTRKRKKLRNQFTPIESFSVFTGANGLVQNPLLLGFAPKANRGILTFHKVQNPTYMKGKKNHVIPSITIGNQSLYIISFHGSMNKGNQIGDPHSASVMKEFIDVWKHAVESDPHKNWHNLRVIIIDGDTDNHTCENECCLGANIGDSNSFIRVDSVERAFRVLGTIAEIAEPLSWLQGFRLTKKSLPKEYDLSNEQGLHSKKRAKYSSRIFTTGINVQE